MSDSEETNYLLGQLLKEVKELRSELTVVTGSMSTRDLDDVHSAIQELRDELSEKLDDVADRITGTHGGIGGSSLDEICTAVDSVASAINLSAK
jgi:DNA-binding ferritin-like protein